MFAVLHYMFITVFENIVFNKYLEQHPVLLLHIGLFTGHMAWLSMKVVCGDFMFFDLVLRKGSRLRTGLCDPRSRAGNASM